MSARPRVDLDQVDCLIERSRVLAMLIGVVASGCALARDSDIEAALMELATLIEETAKATKAVTAVL